MPFTIIVPTDFSQTAEKAFTYALNMASEAGGIVYLFHVYSPIESPFIERVEVREEHNLQEEKALMARLHEMRDKYQPSYSNVKIVVALGRSPMINSIIKFSADMKADFIVMGTQGATGLRKVVIGTIAARILDKTVLPLLLVPERFEWVQPQKIVLATNYTNGDEVAFTLSGRLAQLFGASVHIVHLHEQDEDENRDERSASFTAVLTGDFPGVPVTTSHLPTYSVTETLEDLHEQIPYDLMVMVKHQKNILEKLFLENCTKHMAYLTWHPLLVVPVAEEE